MSIEGSTPFTTFQDATDEVLAFLQARYPMGLWMVTRAVEDDWIVLRARDQQYDVSDGDLFRWSDSLCFRMVLGEAPNIAADSASIPAYAAAPIGQQIPVSSYIGFPLMADGELFGTLCAIDTVVKSDGWAADGDLIGMFTRLLSTILETELHNARLSSLAETLQDAAHRDTLTGSLNRRGWERLMSQAEHNRTVYGSAHSVVVIDLDDLKQTNDEHGHAAGDQMLVGAAAAITGATRRPDVVARIGGDEFGVLLEEPESLDPQSYVDRMLTALADCGVQASVGCARSGPTVSLVQAAQHADTLMYEEKQARPSSRR